MWIGALYAGAPVMPSKDRVDLPCSQGRSTKAGEAIELGGVYVHNCMENTVATATSESQRKEQMRGRVALARRVVPQRAAISHDVYCYFSVTACDITSRGNSPGANG